MLLIMPFIIKEDNNFTINSDDNNKSNSINNNINKNNIAAIMMITIMIS